MRRNVENLKDYTDRAVEASLTNTLIPPLVYIPAGLRRKGVRVAETITTVPPTFEENTIRVEKADPTGFLIALMQGQPLPSFEVTEHQGKVSVAVGWRIADLPLRAEVAMELARRVARAKRNGTPTDPFDAMVERNQKDDV